MKPWASMPRTGALPCSMTRWPILPRTPASILWPCCQPPAMQNPSAARLASPAEGTAGGQTLPWIATDTQYSAKMAGMISTELGIPCAPLNPVANGPENSPLDYYETAMEKPRDLEEVLQIMGPEVCFDNVNREHWRTREFFRISAPWRQLAGPLCSLVPTGPARPRFCIAFWGNVLYGTHSFLENGREIRPSIGYVPQSLMVEPFCRCGFTNFFQSASAVRSGLGVSVEKKSRASRSLLDLVDGAALFEKTGRGPFRW